MKFDDASWHYDGEFPADTPIQYGGTHIALFLRFCFTKGWAGALHLEYEPEATQKVIDGTLLATEFLFKYCGGKLTDEDFDETGNAFAKQYYGEDGLYLIDFVNRFGDIMYRSPESAHDFEELASIIDERLESGILTRAQAGMDMKFSDPK